MEGQCGSAKFVRESGQCMCRLFTLRLRVPFHLWRYSPFWVLPSLRRLRLSSLSSARFLHPLIPRICDVFLRTTSFHLVLGFAAGLVKINPLNPELNPICYLLALLAHHFLHVSRIRVKSLTIRLLMSYIHGAPILDVSRSHTTTQHSR